jgi:hypothetical protein
MTLQPKLNPCKNAANRRIQTQPHLPLIALPNPLFHPKNIKNPILESIRMFV